MRESASVHRPDGGIGRRAGFRYQWPQGRGGSSPFLGTKSMLYPVYSDFF